MKKTLAILATLLMLASVFTACSKADNAEQTPTQAEAGQTTQNGDQSQASSRIVEPTSVDGTGSKLTGNDYAFTAFGVTYTLGKSTLQDFLDNGWTFEEDSYSYERSDPSEKIESYTYASTANLVKDGSTIYSPAFVNFSKSQSRNLADCKLFDFTFYFSNVNLQTGSEITPSNTGSFTLPLGITGDFCMADLMDAVASSGLGHYEQEYDNYYLFYATNEYDDADTEYNIDAVFSKNDQKINSVRFKIDNYTNGEFDEP